MSIKPILFSTPMVQAILDGRKTMTRRVINKDISNQFDIDVDGTAYAYIEPETGDHYKPVETSRIQTGDTLWVRETYREGLMHFDEYPVYEYRADPIYVNSEPDELNERWRPSIFMPKDAARIFLKVTNVRCERVQEILCGDMKREGCIPPTVTGGHYQQWHRDYWIPLWNGINAKRGYGWDANPWVFVYAFEPTDKPEGWPI